MLADSPAFSAFSVDDLDAARTFYGETLGLAVELESEAMGLLSLTFSGGGTAMAYVKDDHTPAAFTILNFPVPDVEAAVDGLSAQGVTMERYDGFDQDEKGINRGPGPRIAWFTDPAGNVLSVIELT